MPPVRPAARRPRAFISADGGATAVEFAMISIPFLALVFAIFELGAMFMASTAIDAAGARARASERASLRMPEGSSGLVKKA